MGKMSGGGMNAKAAAAKEKKAAAAAEKAAHEAAAQERQIAQDWSKGANHRAAAKSQEAASKADEAARKRREKAELLAQEEAANGPGGKAKKTPTLSKGKGKKKNDLSLLEDALVGAADKKVKAKKREEREKAERLKQEQLEREKAKKEQTMDPLLANTQQMIAGTEDDLVGRNANKALDEEVGASGMDAALEALHVGSGGPAAAAPSSKALYKAFEERKLKELKEDMPGLKLSQYKDKIFALWKKSPENPANQMK